MKWATWDDFKKLQKCLDIFFEDDKHQVNNSNDKQKKLHKRQNKLNLNETSLLFFLKKVKCG